MRKEINAESLGAVTHTHTHFMFTEMADSQERKSSLEKISEQRGITLVALVVTIIVLIILATVSINVAIGENGIIKKAELAKKIQANAEASDQEMLEEYDKHMSNMLAENEEKGPSMPDSWDKDKVTVIDDGKGKPVPLPKDFYYVGGDIESGIVISDKSGDTMDASGPTSGNQFVWIPVTSEADLERTKFDDTTGKPTTGLNTTNYTEPFAKGYATEETEYNTMKKQVLKYGGFYIGRYEAGVNTTEMRTGVTEAQPVVSKKGVAPYNYVPWGKSMSDASEIAGKSGVVYLAKSFANGKASVESTLLYGSQWDAMCRYIGDANRTTKYKDDVELTGNVSTDVSKNIYDLAGNCYEWTMEAAGIYNRVFRGGDCYSGEYPVSYRNNNLLGYSYNYRSFRLGLFIK